MIAKQKLGVSGVGAALDVVLELAELTGVDLAVGIKGGHRGPVPPRPRRKDGVENAGGIAVAPEGKQRERTELVQGRIARGV